MRKEHSEDLDVDGRIILKGILGEEYFKKWIHFIWLWRGTVLELL
jgi:hypothetical protein